MAATRETEKRSAANNAERTAEEEDALIPRSREQNTDTQTLNSDAQIVADAPQYPSINVKEAMELLECPVCLDSLLPPIYQCHEGHALCNDCRGKLQLCPTCRSYPIDIRCRALERLADSIGPVNCRYFEVGCREKIQYSARRDHERLCQFRPFRCVHPVCKYEGLSEDLVKHLVEVHGFEHRHTDEIDFHCDRTTKKRFSHGHVAWQRQMCVFRGCFLFKQCRLLPLTLMSQMILL